MDTRRDFIFIDDLVAVVLMAIDGKGGGGTYHISSGSDFAIKELFDATTKALGIKLEKEVESTSAQCRRRIHNSVGSFQNGTRLQLESSYTAGAGVAATVAWYKKFGIQQTFTHLKPVETKRSVRKRRDGHGVSRNMQDQRLLVVGGAGFVGSNLVRHALALECRSVVVVDNLLSSERENLPSDPRITLDEGSIADEELLRRLKDEFDYIFHLATFHGNQNSIADPLADHDHNLITTLRLYEHIKSFRTVKKVVYSASGCTLAPHTFDKPEPVGEDGPIPIELDSPYQISKLVGELYSVYYWNQHKVPIVRARFQNVYGPGEILGAG